ncbi:MAG TPA: hypothetical protein VH044_06875 [Polyangiaceae bacterium]|jgi:hypothetical protein|nr:hypothetical protein [Polyangiaceae bacterium]
MTPIFQPVPSLMLVGVAGDVADGCARAFPALLVLRVGHTAAAVERMMVTRPLVVVLGAELPRGDVEFVVQCARDIQAEVLRESSVPPAEFVEAVQQSLLVAEENRERPTSPE